MSKGRGLAVLFVLLLMVCGGLTWIIYQQLQASPRPAARLAVQDATDVVLPPLQEPRAFQLAALETMEAVLERPLFSQSRRPASKAAAPVEVVPRGDFDLSLRGIVFTDGVGIALLRPSEGTEILRLRSGDRHQGWTLETVEPEKVTFARDNESVTLRLEFDIRSKRAAEPRRPADLGQAVERRKKQLQATRDALRRQLEQQEEKLRVQQNELQKIEQQVGSD